MKSEIQKFFKGEAEDGEEILTKYSRDASLFTVRPRLVVFPKDSTDVKNLVKWVSENKNEYKNKGVELSITARSGGTDMSGGALGESIIIDFTRHMNKLIDFNFSPPRPSGTPPSSSAQGYGRTQQAGGEKFYPLLNEEGVGGGDLATITVQPGMFYRDFEKITAEKGLLLPSYPASKSICALGGMVANNSGGEKTLKYGKTENYVMELKVVLSDGNEYLIKPLTKAQLDLKIKEDTFEGKAYNEISSLLTTNYSLITKAKPNVSKNSAGYAIWDVLKNDPLGFQPLPLNKGEKEGVFDLNKMLVGSQGTLGIITEITFKLVPLPKNSRLTVIFLKDIGEISKLVNDLLKLKPESIEAYDDKTLKLAIKFFPSFLKGKSILGGLKFAWSFWPDLFMLIRHGFPKMIVLVEFAGALNEVNKKSIEAFNIAKKRGLPARVASSLADAEKYWEIRHESFNLLRQHVKGKRTAPFIDDVIVRPEFLPEFLPKLENILAKYPELEHTIAGHPGDGNFHIIPLVDPNNPKLREIILKVADEVYDLVLEYRGSITAEHNDGIIRTPYLEKMFGSEMIAIFKKIKDIFDPLNIFNPGKKVHGTRADIGKYLSKD